MLHSTDALSGSYSEEPATPLDDIGSPGPLRATYTGNHGTGTPTSSGGTPSIGAPRQVMRRASLDSHGLSAEGGSNDPSGPPSLTSASAGSGGACSLATALGGFTLGGHSDETASVRSNGSFATFDNNNSIDHGAASRGGGSAFSGSTSITPTVAPSRSATIEPLELEPTLADAAGPPRRRSMSMYESPVRETSRLMKRRIDGDTKAINDYVVYTRQVLGVGSYSKVKLCCHQRMGTFHAMKIMDKSRLRRLGVGESSGIRKAQREIAILKQIRHENVIALIEVIDDPDAHKLYLVLELAGYGALMNMANDGTVVPDSEGNNKVPESEAKRIIRCVVSALKYVHSQGIAHRDVKPPNILLTDDFDVKLSDFGVSAILDGTPLVACREREGSIAFLSPELLRLDGTDVDLLKADVWALGVTVFTILHGRLPWIARDGSAAEQLQLLESGECPPYGCNGALISPEAVAFMEACLQCDPAVRATTAALANHPWLADDNHRTPFVRPTHDISTEDLDAAITTGRLRDLSNDERRAVPAVPEFIVVRRTPRYAALHFPMSTHILQQSFDDSCLTLVHMSSVASPGGSLSRNSPILSYPSPYGRSRGRVADAASPTGSHGSPHTGGGSRRSVSMPPLEAAPAVLITPNGSATPVHGPHPSVLSSASASGSYCSSGNGPLGARQGSSTSSSATGETPEAAAAHAARLSRLPAVHWS